MIISKIKGKIVRKYLRTYYRDLMFWVEAEVPPFTLGFAVTKETFESVQVGEEREIYLGILQWPYLYAGFLTFDERERFLEYYEQHGQYIGPGQALVQYKGTSKNELLKSENANSIKEALLRLGYSKQTIEAVMKEDPPEEDKVLTPEELGTLVTKYLNKIIHYQ